MLNSPIEEIKNRLDIVDVIKSYIKLQKTGINYRAICPFHSEKSSSYFVSPSRQLWKCFGCGKGGDVFEFVKEVEGIEFGDALRLLAAKAGVELKKQNPQIISQRQRLYEICELSCKFFEKQLWESSAGKEAKDYLLSRKISEDSLRKWRVGYSPDTWQGLSDFLSSSGYSNFEIEKAGLALKGRRDSFYDRFRGRIIFPIYDLNSQPVGFGGRVFKEKDKKESAKYVNISNTLLYDKSRILYGLDKAKVDIRKEDSCILVEGYTDVIMAHQAGTQNVVATSGTALTPFQLKILKRYTENLVLGFDMDIAGETAAKRGIDLAQKAGFNIKVIRLPEGKDAAEIISKDPSLWQGAINSTRSIYDFYFESAFSGRDPKTLEGKKDISKILLPILKKIPNEIEKSFWVQKLTSKLGVKERDVLEEMKKIKLEEEALGMEIEEEMSLPLRSRKEMLERKIIILLAKFPQDADLAEEKIMPCFSPRIAEIINILKKEKALNVENFPSDLTDFLNCVLLESEEENIEKEDASAELRSCLREIYCLELKNKLDAISQEIKWAEEENDSGKIKELTEKFNQLTKELQ